MKSTKAKARGSVRIPFTVDLAAWAAEYGTTETAEDVVEQMKARIADAVRYEFQRFDHMITIGDTK